MYINFKKKRNKECCTELKILNNSYLFPNRVLSAKRKKLSLSGKDHPQAKQ
jgi:hypothetical protein